MANTGDLYSFLKTVDLLAGLSEASLTKLVSKCRVKNVPRGSIIFSRGDPAESWYIIRSGLTAEFTGGPGSVEEVFLKERRPGDLFGEMGIILDGVELVTVIAMKDTSLVVFHRDTFLELLNNEPSVARFLVQTFARRVKASGELYATRSQLQAASRLAFIILRMEKDGGGHGVISVTQDDLAQRCGLARQSVARVLREWRRKGWISTYRGRLAIKDLSAISSVLE